MRKYGNEFKVGLFFILCVLGFFFLTYKTGKLNMKKEGYHIYAIFDEIAGLNKNAPVMLNGLEVGKVDNIEISYNGDRTTVKLRLWLDKKAKVRANPTISIKTLGLMGEKYIQISSSQGNKFVEQNAILKGKPYTDMDALMDEAQNISKHIDNLVRNANSLTDEVKKLAKNLNYTVDNNQDEITRIIQNLEVTSKNMQEFSEDIKSHPWKLLFRSKKKRPRK